MTAVVQLVLLSAMALQALQAALAAPGALGAGAFPGYGGGGGFFNRGAYSGAGGYNPAYDGPAGFDPYPPQYNFDYRVAEPRTGDYKNHQESRNGDAVRGQYSVAEPDGSLLTVNYAADDAHGYTAQVTRSGAGGTVVQSFPGPAPLPAAAGYVAPAAGYAAPAGGYVAPAAVPLAAGHHGAGAHFGSGAAFGSAAFGAPYNNYNRGFGAAGAFGAAYHPGFGTSSTSFRGPHAAYSYTN